MLQHASFDPLWVITNSITNLLPLYYKHSIHVPGATYMHSVYTYHQAAIPYMGLSKPLPTPYQLPFTLWLAMDNMPANPLLKQV